MRARYIIDDSTPGQLAVWEIPDLRTPILHGHLVSNGESWTARLARDPKKAADGWVRRTDAATWLILASTGGRA